MPAKLGIPCKLLQLNTSMKENSLDKTLSPVDPRRVVRAYAGPTSPALVSIYATNNSIR